MSLSNLPQNISSTQDDRICYANHIEQLQEDTALFRAFTNPFEVSHEDSIFYHSNILIFNAMVNLNETLKAIC
jgi:hypothetical protein